MLEGRYAEREKGWETEKVDEGRAGVIEVHRSDTNLVHDLG